MRDPFFRPLAVVLLIMASALIPGSASAIEIEPEVERALERLYNFDFDSAHATLDAYQEVNPDDPVAYGVRGAVYLFFELDRLRILETEFFRDDERIEESRKLRTDPAVRSRFMASLDRAEELAEGLLAEDAENPAALFALVLKGGLEADYLALIDKKGLRSLKHAWEANSYAQRLLEIRPDAHDAYLANGISEYVLGSLPFFIRWFVRPEGVEGSKERAFERLEMVADRGRYLGPFARILLSVISLREDQPERAKSLLADLTRDYPENPLLRKELDKVTRELASAER